MKNLITKEEIEFIVLQLIDQGKFDEADEMLKQSCMSRPEQGDPKTMRYHDWNPEGLD
jgi:hypothetical protein